MAHLAPGTGLGLAIEMKFGVVLAQDFIPGIHIITQKIGHLHVELAFHTAERQPADSAHQLFELGGGAGVLCSGECNAISPVALPLNGFDKRTARASAAGGLITKPNQRKKSLVSLKKINKTLRQQDSS